MLKVVTKNMFFDRQKIQNRLDRKRTVVLTRTGGFARKTMQRSMRYRAPKGKPSRPGQPPKANRKFPLLRELIVFGYDKSTQSVAVGTLPRKVSAVSDAVPETLNEGGTMRVVLPGGEIESVRYLPRPFATQDSPAGVAGRAKFQELTETTPL